jgi:hypothetical protein
MHLRPSGVFLSRVCLSLLLVPGTVCLAGTALAATIVNGTRTAMVSLQIKSGHSGWHGNLLDDGPLGVQRHKTIYGPSDGCVYDLKATFEDGHRVMRPRVNLCAPSMVVIRDF